MFKKIIFAVLLICAALSLSAQSGIRPFQIKLLPNGFTYVGVGGVNTAVDIATQAELDAIAAAGFAGIETAGTVFSGDGQSGTELTFVPGNLLLSTVNNDAGFITSADDADANPSNELQTISQGATSNTATLSNSGGDVDTADNLTRDVFTATGAETTFTLSATPAGGTKTLLIYRNGVEQEVGVDVTLSGTTVTITGTAAETGEKFRSVYVAQ